jgi:adenosylcobinamide kinase/adenosylcobinamide-phosphate guanylyltransferase
MGFTTVEQGRDILGCLKRMGSKPCILLDSVTALLSNEMFPPSGAPDPDSPGRVAAQLQKLVAEAKHAVFVSDFIYSDALLYNGYTELFRRGLAAADRTLVGCCDTVVEACTGRYFLHKGVLPR